jgi:hypothetical protein
MSNNFTSHFSADDAALVLIDFQPQMFMGIESHDRNAIKNNLQIIAKSAKLFNVPTVLSTVTAETFSGPFVPEVTEGVFPGHEVVDRTSINAWLTPKFVKASKQRVASASSLPASGRAPVPRSTRSRASGAAMKCSLSRTLAAIPAFRPMSVPSTA